MKLIYDGHEYNYDDNVGHLRNNYQTLIARIVKPIHDVYYYGHLKNAEESVAIHEDIIQDTPRARALWLIHSYTTHEE